MPYIATLSDVFTNITALAIFLALAALLIWAFVAFFRGPAKQAEAYVDGLAMQINSASDRALFLNMYRASGPRSVVVAWLLTVFLSPTISYVYQGKWGLAIIALVTFQGLLIWWIISWFSMPTEVMKYNKTLADKAFNQLMVNRPQTSSAIMP